MQAMNSLTGRPTRNLPNISFFGSKAGFCAAAVILLAMGKCMAQVDLIQSARNPKDLFAADPPYAQITPECQEAKAFLQQRRVPAATLNKMSCADAIRIAGDIQAQEFAREQRIKAEHAADTATDAVGTAKDIADAFMYHKPDPIGMAVSTFFKDVDRIPKDEEKLPYSDLRTGPFPNRVKPQIPWPDTSLPKVMPRYGDGPAFEAPSPLGVLPAPSS